MFTAGKKKIKSFLIYIHDVKTECQGKIAIYLTKEYFIIFILKMREIVFKMIFFDLKLYKSYN
jgi:hypothetical protein